MALFLLLHVGETDLVAGCSLIERGRESALRSSGIRLAEDLGKDPARILTYNVARQLPSRAKYSLVIADDRDIDAWNECSTHAQKVAWWEHCQAQGLIKGTVYEHVLVRKTKAA